MKKLMILVLLSLGFIACGTQDEPRKNRKEEYPIVMVDFLPGNRVDADGDPEFFVYRCKYCFGVKSGLSHEQDLLSQAKKEIFNLKNKKVKKSQEEAKRKRLEELERKKANSTRIINKMLKARKEFLEQEAN